MCLPKLPETSVFHGVKPSKAEEVIHKPEKNMVQSVSIGPIGVDMVNLSPTSNKKTTYAMTFRTRFPNKVGKSDMVPILERNSFSSL